jgi:hypothetical protein
VVILVFLALAHATPPISAQEAAPGFQAYSKFDFVPGEKIVAVDEFSQDAIGDFPDKWNTDGSGEIVTIAGKTGRWLKLTKAGFFTPEHIRDLPDNFTFEFDLTVPPTFEGRPLMISLTQLENIKQPNQWNVAPQAFLFTTLPQPDGGRPR